MRLRAYSGLRRKDFTCLAENGFGDPYNGVSHSMAYFQDRLYVGTSRCNMHMIGVNQNKPSTFTWPVKLPADVYELDRRAQIWRHDPRTGQWKQVYSSPLIKAEDGTEVPQDIGYRAQVVFRGRSDSAPALYTCTWSPSKGTAPVLLRSTDGTNFERVGPLGSGARAYNTFRTLIEFQGRLYTSPTGMTSGYGRATECQVDSPILYETSDPATEPWREASLPSFGDPTNLTFFDMAVFNGFLYAGTLNPVTGFQVWKTRAEGKPPYQWTRVITNGAYRGKVNEIAMSMCVFNNALYVGSGIQNGGRDRIHNIGPAGSELIRIHPDDTWDLIVGTERDTPEGYKYPLSGFGPGFNSGFNPIFWRMAAHDGWLYLGTYNWTLFLPYLSQQNWPDKLKKWVNSVGVEKLVQMYGGFDLWRTMDGVRWFPVSRNGFDNFYNYGIRTMVSTPHGLYVGTANTFGPEVGVRNEAGEWEYVPNPRSGTEVWLGASVLNRGAEAREGWFGRPPEIHAPFGHKSFEPLRSALKSQDPADTLSRLKTRYEGRMFNPVVDEYYGESGFYSWGYWDDSTRTQKDACFRMMEKLLEMIPQKTGTILDVGCGKGATTGYLLKYYPAEMVTGIDISEKLLEAAEKNAPGCTFMLMDAARTTFEDQSFDNILSVDAAALFNTREKFIEEAYRLLKPGGRLIVSDRLLSREAIEGLESYHSENYVPDLRTYEQLYAGKGFVDLRVEDVTSICLDGYSKHFLDFLKEKRRTGEIDDETFRGFEAYVSSRRDVVSHYVFVSARKPAATNGTDGTGTTSSQERRSVAAAPPGRARAASKQKRKGAWPR